MPFKARPRIQRMLQKGIRRNTLDKTDKHDSTGQRENVAPQGHDTLRNRNALGNLFRKSQFIHKFTRKMPRPKTRTHTFCEPAQSKCTSTFHKSHFIRKFKRKMPRPKTRTHTLCEPAQSKCTSTFHKSHFLRKFTGEMPCPSWGTLIKHRPLHLHHLP